MSTCPVIMVRVSSAADVYAAPMYATLVWAGDVTPVPADFETPWCVISSDGAGWGWDDAVEAELLRRGLEGLAPDAVEADAGVVLASGGSYTEDDAVLDALRAGLVLLKVPDTASSPYFRCYVKGGA